MSLCQKCWSAVLVLTCCLPGVANDNSQADPKLNSSTKQTDSKEIENDLPRVSLEVARDRAKVMHDLYSATLDTMHHHYFHIDRATLPARAMEDLFKDIQRKQHSQARWISASFKPMSIDHKPNTEFEKEAARKIAKGEECVETIEEGYYRRAGSISLNHGCISCHSGTFGGTSTAKKFAGLVISIPVVENARVNTQD